MQIRRRRLPHLTVIGQPLFVTFRLHGSLPPSRTFPDESMTSGKAFVSMDRLLDHNRREPQYLGLPNIAQLVVDNLLSGAQADYDAHAWVLMPNHVHLLITPHTERSQWLQRLKGRTAHAANQLLGRTGQPFWQDERYDHLVRNDQEFRRIEQYIVQNPVTAGLAATPEAFHWSSAFTEEAG